MSKTIDLQVEKSRALINGYRKHLDELAALGVNDKQLDKMQNDLEKLIDAGNECDKIRAELATRVHVMNDILQTVKEDFQQQKHLVKAAHDQTQWARFGIMDKR